MRLFTIECPGCGETKARHLLARTEYSPVAPQVVGGILWALIFVLSRKRRFRCGRCAREFFSHTVASRIWLAFWIVFCLGVGFGIGLIFVALLASGR